MYLCPGVPSETVKYQERHCSPNVLQVTETRRCRTTQLVAVAGTNPTEKLGQRAGRLRRGRHYLRRQALAELTSRGRWVVGVRRFGRSKSVARRAPSGHFKAGCLFLKKKRFRLHGVAPKGPFHFAALRPASLSRSRLAKSLLRSRQTVAMQSLSRCSGPVPETDPMAHAHDRRTNCLMHPSTSNRRDEEAGLEAAGTTHGEHPASRHSTRRRTSSKSPFNTYCCRLHLHCIYTHRCIS
jgi:hypothetical protein